MSEANCSQAEGSAAFLREQADKNDELLKQLGSDGPDDEAEILTYSRQLRDAADEIDSLAKTRAYCGRCAHVLKQIVDLGNINEETRKTLRHLGNGLNDTARAGLPNK